MASKLRGLSPRIALSRIFRPQLHTFQHHKPTQFHRQFSTSMPSPSEKTPSLAILDDYLSTSTPHFSHLSPSLSITTFNDTIIPSLSPESHSSLVTRLQPFELISTIRERTPFPATLLRSLPNLKLLLATGTQFETFDLREAAKLGIAVVAAPGRGRTDRPYQASGQDIRLGGQHPTTQHAWALILALARRVAEDDAGLREGRLWHSGLAIGLTGKTLGVVGLGRLGAAVARIGRVAWGMRVVCWSENLIQAKADGMAEKVGIETRDERGGATFEVVGKEELFRRADVVSLHYVLSERSRGVVGERELGAMKKGGLLVNTSRGPLMDGEALRRALEEGRIGGAALDVFDLEPLPMESVWRKKDYWGKEGRGRLLITPHMGYADEGMINTWYAETAENVERWLEGRELLHKIA